MEIGSGAGGGRGRVGGGGQGVRFVNQAKGGLRAELGPGSWGLEVGGLGGAGAATMGPVQPRCSNSNQFNTVTPGAALLKHEHTTFPTFESSREFCHERVQDSGATHHLIRPSVLSTILVIPGSPCGAICPLVKNTHPIGTNFVAC